MELRCSPSEFRGGAAWLTENCVAKVCILQDREFLCAPNVMLRDERPLLVVPVHCVAESNGENFGVIFPRAVKVDFKPLGTCHTIRSE